MISISSWARFCATCATRGGSGRRGSLLRRWRAWGGRRRATWRSIGWSNGCASPSTGRRFPSILKRAMADERDSTEALQEAVRALPDNLPLRRQLVARLCEERRFADGLLAAERAPSDAV